MKKVNIAINTRNTFLRESLVSVVNELISRSGNLKVAFSYKHNDFLDKDIIIAEVLPGEIYLCNTSIKNRKKNSSVIILHSYDKLPEKELIERAAGEGVRVYGMSEAVIGENKDLVPSTVILGYANLKEKEIQEGCMRLARAWK